MELLPNLPRSVAPRAGLVALVLLALVVRVAVAIASDGRYAPHSDPWDYDQHAVSIAHGDGYPPSSYAPGGGPSALRPPLYPYVLGGLYAAVGHSTAAGRALAVALGVLTVVLIGVLAHQLAGLRAARWSMAIGAVFPPLVLVSATLISESLSLPLMLGALAAALRHRRRPEPGWGWAALAGALLGLGLLARPAMAVVAIPLVLLLWTGPRRSARGLAAPAIALLATAVVLVPWTVRNYDAFGALVPISTQSSYLLAGTYNPVSMNDPAFPAGYQIPTVVPRYRRLWETTQLGELAFSRRLSAGARDYISAHPGSIPKALYHNTLRILQLDRGAQTGELSYAAQGIGRGWARAAQVGFYVLCLLALASLPLRAGRRWWPLLWGTTILLLLSVVPISSDTRYRLQFEPLLVLLAGIAIAAWLDRRRRRRPHAPAPEPVAGPPPADHAKA